MRCQKLWQDKVPELITHEKEGLPYTLKNSQHATISPGNIPEELVVRTFPLAFSFISWLNFELLQARGGHLTEALRPESFL
jgi:hypothetical protein